MNYGYARVSSKDQNLDRQLLVLQEFGISDKHIYVDRKSGKDFERPGYKKLIRRLKPQDVLVIGS
ncbi:recombinase family protein, partial [Neglecta sp. X4]